MIGRLWRYKQHPAVISINTTGTWYKLTIQYYYHSPDERSNFGRSKTIDCPQVLFLSFSSSRTPHSCLALRVAQKKLPSCCFFIKDKVALGPRRPTYQDHCRVTPQQYVAGTHLYTWVEIETQCWAKYLV